LTGRARLLQADKKGSLQADKKARCRRINDRKTNGSANFHPDWLGQLQSFRQQRSSPFTDKKEGSYVFRLRTAPLKPKQTMG
jgi:hypothetical protein